MNEQESRQNERRLREIERDIKSLESERQTLLSLQRTDAGDGTASVSETYVKSDPTDPPPRLLDGELSPLDDTA